MDKFLNSYGKELYDIYLSKDLEYRETHSFEDFIDNLIECECCNDYFDEEEIITTESGENICEQCMIDGYGQ